MYRLLIVFAIAVCAASAQAADAKKDLTEDTCSALQLASCGRAPYAICHASDGVLRA